METKNVDNKEKKNNDFRNRIKEQFKCFKCSFDVPYSYFGVKPPFCKSLVLIEDSYVMQDPFGEGKKFIVVGANCSICKSPVCKSMDCSLFYTKTFCLKCVERNSSEFPDEILQDIEKKNAGAT